MYSPPTATATTSSSSISSSHLQPQLPPPSPSSLSSAKKQTTKLPSLPPFPSLVSSLGEGRQSNSPNSAPSPSISHSSYSNSYEQRPLHHRQEAVPPSESAGRSGWLTEGAVPQSREPVRSRTATSNTTLSSSSSSTPLPGTSFTSSHIEDHKPGLPLPVGFSEPHYRGGLHSSPQFGSSTGMMSGLPGNGSGHQYIERESSIRTGSSASTSEPPLSPRHTGGAGPEKRRRLSAAHEVYPHHIIHAPDDDDSHDQDAQMIDELSPMIHQSGSHHQDEELGSPQTGDDSAIDNKKGANGRTLKQTKRAAQNRAAQQAFRKRKEERIKELEEKEKILNNLVARENELIKKERILAEKENAFMRNKQHGIATTATAPTPGGPSGPSSSSQHSAGDASSATSASTAATATNDWDRAFASAPVASPIQHIAERLEASNRANEALRAEIEQLKDRLMDKSNLIESLRRSLEDLGAENRNLRETNRKQAEVLEFQAAQARAGGPAPP